MLFVIQHRCIDLLRTTLHFFHPTLSLTFEYIELAKTVTAAHFMHTSVEPEN